MASGIVGYGVRGFGVWVGGLGFLLGKPPAVSSSAAMMFYAKGNGPLQHLFQDWYGNMYPLE